MTTAGTGGKTPSGQAGLAELTAQGTREPAAWLGVAFGLIALAKFGLAEPIQLVLVLVIAYVALAHAASFAPAINRLNAALAGRPAPAAPARGAR